MLMGLRDFLCGWREATVPAEERLRVFSLLYEHSLPFTREKMHPDGAVSFRIRERDARLLDLICRNAGADCRLSETHGLPVVLRFFRARPMIPLGILVTALWLWYGGHIIWDVRVTGNTKTPTEEIIARLADLGCGVGDWIPSIDFNDLHARYAADQHEIAWLSVVMDGTVAEVQVRELRRDERTFPDENEYANVTAREAGVIEIVNVIDGQAAVKPGELVRPGQVLISGIVEKKEGDFRYEYARGEAWATVTVPISVTVERNRTVLADTGRQKRQFCVKIFKKSINLFGKGGIEYPTYDKIDKIEQLCPFGLTTLPVWITETVIREKTERTETVSASAAAEEALTKLRERIRAETVNGELVGRTVTVSETDGACRIDCVLTLRREIGLTVPFTVVPQDG